MHAKFSYIVLFLMIVSCSYTVSIKNENQGLLKSKYHLVVSNGKKFLLDDETAPKPPYMRILKEANGEATMTFINPYKNAIYFFDYEKAAFKRKIVYDKEGPNGIIKLNGYYIKNMDSIYTYNFLVMEVALTDSLAFVKQRISLCDNRVSLDNRTDREWPSYYPQYVFNSVNPLIEIDGKLVLTGMSPFGVVDSLIHKFCFTSSTDLKTGGVSFFHTYPAELYGSNPNWQAPVFMQPYREISPTGEYIYSFPISHHLYIANPNEEGYKTVYAGSNAARTIRSINERGRTSHESIVLHILQHDLYAAILYDPYRRMYYRYMLKGIPDVTINTRMDEKSLVVIVMDEQFNYLGETLVGKEKVWNWKNSFVTSEGLNIEYISVEDEDEDYMIFKILTTEKIE